MLKVDPKSDGHEQVSDELGAGEEDIEKTPRSIKETNVEVDDEDINHMQISDLIQKDTDGMQKANIIAKETYKMDKIVESLTSWDSLDEQHDMEKCLYEAAELLGEAVTPYRKKIEQTKKDKAMQQLHAKRAEQSEKYRKTVKDKFIETTKSREKKVALRQRLSKDAAERRKKAEKYGGKIEKRATATGREVAAGVDYIKAQKAKAKARKGELERADVSTGRAKAAEKAKTKAELKKADIATGREKATQKAKTKAELKKADISTGREKATQARKTRGELERAAQATKQPKAAPHVSKAAEPAKAGPSLVGKAAELAKAHGRKVAAGAAVAGILYGGYKLYKAWKAKGDAAKGKKAQAANLKANLAKCNKSADPAKCKAAIQKKIASLK